MKNNTLGQIRWEQMVFLGNPEYVFDLAPIDLAAFARACGGAGFTIENLEDCCRHQTKSENAALPSIAHLQRPDPW